MIPLHSRAMATHCQSDSLESIRTRMRSTQQVRRLRCNTLTQGRSRAAAGKCERRHSTSASLRGQCDSHQRQCCRARQRLPLKFTQCTNRPQQQRKVDSDSYATATDRSGINSWFGCTEPLKPSLRNQLGDQKRVQEQMGADTPLMRRALCPLACDGVCSIY